MFEKLQSIIHWIFREPFFIADVKSDFRIIGVIVPLVDPIACYSGKCKNNAMVIIRDEINGTILLSCEDCLPGKLKGTNIDEFIDRQQTRF